MNDYNRTTTKTSISRYNFNPKQTCSMYRELYALCIPVHHVTPSLRAVYDDHDVCVCIAHTLRMASILDMYSRVRVIPHFLFERRNESS